MIFYFTGLQNLTALGNVVRWQKVEYDFEFHKQDFECNIPVLVLSEGKSLLQVSSSEMNSVLQLTVTFLVGHITLVAVTVITALVPYLIIKSLQPSRSWDTHSFHLPDHQINFIDLYSTTRYLDGSPVMTHWKLALFKLDYFL